MKEWAHLPNAEHIDYVFDMLREHPQMFTDAWNGIYPNSINAARAPGLVARVAAWDAASAVAAADAIKVAAADAIKVAAWDAVSAAGHRPRNAATQAAAVAAGAIFALIAYDDCAYMLESNPEELAIIAKLGDQRAILFFPACVAFSKIKNAQIIPARKAANSTIL